MEREKYILHIKGWGYYGGPSAKYYDMFNILPKEYAKRFESRKEAEELKERLEDGEYEVVIEEVEE